MKLSERYLINSMYSEALGDASKITVLLEHGLKIMFVFDNQDEGAESYEALYKAMNSRTPVTASLEIDG